MKKLIAVCGVCFGLFIMQLGQTLQHFDGDHQNQRRKRCVHCWMSHA
jgi:hypothetical protein